MPWRDFRIMTEARQRLFFALWPDAVLRERIAALLPELARQGAQAVAADNLHLTLAFLGNVTATQRDCMVRLAEDMRPPSFALTLDRFGHWPGPGVVWLGPSAWPEQLDHLAASLTTGMRRCGLQPDPRPYTPHVTLLRKAREMPELPAGLVLPWQASAFVLCESRSTERGVVYSVLEHWPMQSGQA